MNGLTPVQKAVVALLKADAGVAAIVGARVYSKAPRRRTYPYVTIGPVGFRPERNDCMTRRIQDVQIDGWVRDEKVKATANDLADAIHAALDQASLTLDGPFGAGRCDVLLVRVLDDPDGITRHAVVQAELDLSAVG